MATITLTTIKTEMAELTDYLKANYPRAIPVPLDRESKKVIDRWVFAADKITDEELWNKWETQGKELVESGKCDVGLTLRGGLVVWDFDSKEQFGILKEDVPEMMKTVVVETAKGFHAYFALPDDCELYHDTTTFRKHNFKIDILGTHRNGTGGCVVMPPSKGKTWINKLGEYDIIDLPKSLYDGYIKYKGLEKVDERRRDEVVVEGKVSFEKLEAAVMEGLKDARADIYGDWITVIWAIINEATKGEYYERGCDLCHKFSQRSRKYVDWQVELEIAKTQPRADGVGMGTILKMVKEDNLEVFDRVKSGVLPEGYAFGEIDEIGEEVVDKKWEALLKDIVSGEGHDASVINFIAYVLNGRFKCANIKGQDVYWFNGNLWEQDEGLCRLTKAITTDVYKGVVKGIGMYSQKVAASSSDVDKRGFNESMKILGKVAAKLMSSSYKRNIYTDLLKALFEKGFASLLDSRTHLIGFENGVYDLDAGVFRQGRPDDYVSMSVGYDWTETVNEKAKGVVMDFITSIHATEEMRDYHLDTMALSLHGTKMEQLVMFWTGTGGNGKSLLTRLLKKAFGKYHYEPPVQLYTEKRRLGAFPELVDAKGVRSLVSQEPDDKAVIQVNILKMMTGGDTITARPLYKEQVSFVLQAIITICMNYKPVLSSTDGGIVRRLRIILFPFRFRLKPIDPMDKVLDFSIEGKLLGGIDAAREFMRVLIERYRGYRVGGFVLNTPQKVLDDTEEYINSQNFVREFINDEFDMTNVREKAIEFSDVYNMFRSWAAGNSNPLMGKATFTEELKLMGLNIDKCKKGKLRDRRVVYGLKVKVRDIEDEDEDMYDKV